MFAIKSVTVLFLMIILVSNCERRIKDGRELTVDRRYMVYLVKAPVSNVGYDNWLCGGAIVSSMLVVTSAACVNDVDYLYVIAGYRTYIQDADIETDPCTSSMKKKVVFTCTPMGYELKFGEIDYWSYIDIALVRVESPFDFDDPKYESQCSYKPATIPINYEEKYQQPGTDAIVLGWGHLNNWRKPEDSKIYNQASLKYAPTLLLDKEECIKHYTDYTNMSKIIRTYMICSLGSGNIDDHGQPIQQSVPFQNGCTKRQEKVLGFEGVSCEDDDSTESVSYDDDDDYDNTRRYGNTNSNTTNNNTTIHSSRNDINETRSRRSGICQNDHGGPIITWAGANEVLIGVASVFKVSDEYECMGPYLYTSTLCTGSFLDCILSTEFPTARTYEQSRRTYLCDRPAKEKGYDTIERTISWKDHPAGPAENENIERSAPEPEMAPGLKYLMNNNNQPRASTAAETRNQETIKFPSDTVVQADKNPAIASPAHIERFQIKERDPVNDRQQETVFKSRNKYPANKLPSIISYARKIMNMYRNPENKQISGNESFPVNDRYLDINRHDNDTSPATVRYSTNGKFTDQTTIDPVN